MAEPKQGYDVVSAHMLKEDFIQRGLKDDRFPFRVSAAFSLLALFLLLLASLAADRNEMLMAAGGTDLLLYLLANAILSLGVHEFERFVKRSVLAYLIHVVILSGLLYLFLGGLPEDAREVLPVYGALIMSFFLSVGLVVLIRQVLSILREK